MGIKIGDVRTYSFVVKEADIAAFESGEVHKVCSTFALAREAEWAGRLLLLEMIADDEEGIGTMVSVYHKGMALPGSLVDISAEAIEIAGNNLKVKYVARVGDRIVAEGETGQKILKKSKIQQLFEQLKP